MEVETFSPLRSSHYDKEMAKNHRNQRKTKKNHKRYAVVMINHSDPRVTYNCQIPDPRETDTR
jgi:hypothetical protein